MKLFVGLDVPLEKIAICVISEHLKIVKEAQVASEPGGAVALDLRSGQRNCSSRA
ncbi:MAG: hypothetical protein ACK4HF_15960 [Paracoccaceae bacterium]